MALASTDVSGSVPAVSYGVRDLDADAGMKGHHATTQVFSPSPAFALILLTLDAWKRMQMSELQRRAERPAPRRATCPRSASCDMFWGATRIGTPRAATPVGAALRAVPAQGRITLGATRIGTHSAATPPGAALRAVPAQGRFGMLPCTCFVRDHRAGPASGPASSRSSRRSGQQPLAKADTHMPEVFEVSLPDEVSLQKTYHRLGVRTGRRGGPGSGHRMVWHLPRHSMR